MFQELKEFLRWGDGDEAVLRGLHAILSPDFARITDVFYQRVLEHQGARAALMGGESQVGRLKITLASWMGRLLSGPWDEEYFELRCRIGRVHVLIALPQHYMVGAMNVVRQEFARILFREFASRPMELGEAQTSVSKVLDLDLAIMLHAYREDLLMQQSRLERLSTFGQFVGAISHELRNPLGVIESSLYIIKNRAGDNERIVRHAHRIGEQLTIANSIITGLLDVSRDRRDRPLVHENVQLRALFQGALSSLTVPAGVKVSAEGLDDLTELKGDPTQLHQVLRNLLANALQAVGNSGAIAVRAQAISGKLEVAVADSGPGVEPVIRNRLFEPLISARTGGIGLGLSLAKRLVERHGGTISYAPQGPGARFVISLPIGQPAGPAPASNGT